MVKSAIVTRNSLWLSEIAVDSRLGIVTAVTIYFIGNIEVYIELRLYNITQIDWFGCYLNEEANIVTLRIPFSGILTSGIS